MNEKLLCKCQSGIVATNVIEVLEANGIASRSHDEANDPRTGAYGPAPGIAIYVYEDHYEKALILAEPILNRRADTAKSFCPKCGSGNIVHVERSRYTAPLLILSIFLFIAPCVYWYYTMGSKNELTAIDYLAVIVFIASIVIMIAGSCKNASYKCSLCGRKFN